MTLIEIVLVLSVIAILAALLVPSVLGQTDKARLAAEKESLRAIAVAFRKFYEDTGRWPLEDGVWPGLLDIDPGPFGVNDTALFAAPTWPALACAPNTGDLPCWGGPYLTGSRGGATSLGAQRDPWNQPRMFAMFVPLDVGAGGAPDAPNGSIVVWSTGPDRLDQTGCTTGSCTRDINRIAVGLPSVQADDIIVVVGSAK